jgi:hypothetical protein
VQRLSRRRPGYNAISREFHGRAIRVYGRHIFERINRFSPRKRGTFKVRKVSRSGCRVAVCVAHTASRVSHMLPCKGLIAPTRPPSRLDSSTLNDSLYQPRILWRKVSCCLSCRSFLNLTSCAYGGAKHIYLWKLSPYLRSCPLLVCFPILYLSTHLLYLYMVKLTCSL